MTSPTETFARNATLADLGDLLLSQNALKHDFVAPASKIWSVQGQLVVEGGDVALGPDGVTNVSSVFNPTSVCDEGIADKLSIPVGYLKRMRTTRTDLVDANVNGWLHGHYDLAVSQSERVGFDERSFLIRTFASPNEPGIARAFLSDRYRMYDHLDVLTAALEGVRSAGTQVEIDGCDLTERRMQVRLVAPEMKVLAPDLLRNYRSPFDLQGIERASSDGRALDSGREIAARAGQGYDEGDEPVLFAGFVLSNSETGGGAFTLTPRIVVRVCKNGLTFTADAVRNIHLGGRLDAGVIRWSDGTHEANLDLVRAQTRDAVSTFLDVDYVRAKLAEIESLAANVVARPEETVKAVVSACRIGAERTEAILAHFIAGGQLTTGGVMQAVTSVAQTIEDPDTATDLEAQAIPALVAAARFASR